MLSEINIKVAEGIVETKNWGKNLFFNKKNS
ncbi:hypothetical protein MCETHM1_02053 [Flavobacteriaceae bacterium]|jgi:hypothetical protein